MQYRPDQIRYIEKVCQEKGFDFEILDEHSGYLASVSDGSKKLLVGAGLVCAYPLNAATGYTLAIDKAHTYNILSRAGFPVPTGDYFFLSQQYWAVRGEGKTFYDALKYATQLGFPVFGKPNRGSRGEYAQEILNENELIHHLISMLPKHPICLIQELLTGHEFRIFMLDGQAKFAYKRTKPYLLGDGESTVRQLLQAFNEMRFGRGLEPIPEQTGVLQRQLRQKSLTLGDILPEGAELQYSSSANITGGGGIEDFTTEVPGELTQLCQRIAKEIGLRVCAIDMMAKSRELARVAESYCVIEVNGNPALSGLESIGRHDLICSIWSEILETAFEEYPQ